MSAPTQAEYEHAILDTARIWRVRADDLLAAGWAPEIAYEAAADEASGGDCPQEATIQQMTRAAVRVIHSNPVWPHAEDFKRWWNAKFADAPLVEDIRAPCLAEIGGVRVAIIAAWRVFMHDWRQERAS